MDKNTIINALTEKYNSFTNYVNELAIEDYSFSYNQKWTAGQQLEHMVLCVKPLVQVFSLDKSQLEQKFGKLNRPGVSYEMLLNDYSEKLNGGGKAPEQYVPGKNATEREVLSATLSAMIKILCSKIEVFTEQDLDVLSLPHPLLGKLTMREMLYNAIYHVQHHHEVTKLHLRNK